MEAQVVWKSRGVARVLARWLQLGGEQGGHGGDWRAQEWGQGSPFSWSPSSLHAPLPSTNPALLGLSVSKLND